MHTEYSMRLKDVLTKSIQFFKDKKIESYRLDAELLIAHALKMDRVSLYIKYEQPLSDSEVQICREFVRRRSLGEPVAYIIEEKGFFGQVFKVLPGVLIPRPETEHVVEETLKFIETYKIENPRILDLGAGTGCIGLSILKQTSSATLMCVDKSEKAIQNIHLNIKKLGFEDRVEVFPAAVEELDLSRQKFDCVVSNPPYIDKNDPEVERDVKKYEPEIALFAENNGLLSLKNWSKLSVSYLNKPGFMAFEMGYLQGSEMKSHFEALNVFAQVKIVKDLAGKDRVIVGIT